MERSTVTISSSNGTAMVLDDLTKALRALHEAYLGISEINEGSWKQGQDPIPFTCDTSPELAASFKDLTEVFDKLCKAGDHEFPESRSKTTLGKWLEQTHQTVSVSVMTSDQEMLPLNAIPYLSDEDKENGIQYSQVENWLMSQPVSEFCEEGAVISLPYSENEARFLLQGITLPGLTSATNFARYFAADPDFAQRLAFLEEGKSFEIPFDANCMDAVSKADRTALCEFLADHANVFVEKFGEPGPSMGSCSYGVYALDVKGDGSVAVSRPDDFIIQYTEPGKGLSSNLEGKIYFAQHKAKQAEQSVLHPLKDFSLEKG